MRLAYFIVLSALSLTAAYPQMQWQPIGPPGIIPRELQCGKNHDAYLSTYLGTLYFSSDDGLHWNLTTGDGSVFGIDARGFVFDDMLNRSTNGGATWTGATIDGDTFPHALVFAECFGMQWGDTLYAGSGLDGVYRSTDEGANWHHVSVLPTACVYSIVRGANGAVMIGADTDVYVSLDGVDHVQLCNPPNSSHTEKRLWTLGSTVYCDADAGMVCTTNNGSSWSRTNRFVNHALLLDAGDTLWSDSANCLFISTDTGASWHAAAIMRDMIVSLARTSAGTLLCAAGNTGVHRSSDGGATWSESWQGIHAANVTLIQMLARDSIMVNYRAPVVTIPEDFLGVNSVTGDMGKTWSMGPSTNIVSACLDNSGRLLAVSLAGLGYPYILARYNFSKGTMAVVDSDVSIICRDSFQHLYAVKLRRILYSTDNGTTWEDRTPVQLDTVVASLCIDANGTIHVASLSGTIFTSVNDGATWISITVAAPLLDLSKMIASSSGDFYVYSYDSIVRISSAGDSRTIGKSMHGTYRAIIESPSGKIYVGGDSAVYQLVGDSTLAPIGRGISKVQCLVNDGVGGIFAGTRGNGVYHSDLTSSITETRVYPKDVRMVITPNPATTSAMIAYTLEQPSIVALDVCDDMGRIVLRKSNNGMQHPGFHTSVIDLRSLSAGKYWCRLRIGEYVTAEGVVVVK